MPETFVGLNPTEEPIIAEGMRLAMAFFENLPSGEKQSWLRIAGRFRAKCGPQYGAPKIFVTIAGESMHLSAIVFHRRTDDPKILLMGDFDWSDGDLKLTLHGSQASSAHLN